MSIKYICYCLGFILFIYSSSLYAVRYEAYDEDMEPSKNHFLISGIEDEEAQAAITICMTPRSTLINHVALVFEMRDPNTKEIDLFTIHFGGDGHTLIFENDRPSIDLRGDTLKKVYRGKYIFDSGPDKELTPIYTQKTAFTVKYEDAKKAKDFANNSHNLKYSIFGGLPCFTKKYNCCTYAAEVLEQAGINIHFNKSFLPKAPFLFTLFCNNYDVTEGKAQRVIKEFKPYPYLLQPIPPKLPVPPSLTRGDLERLCAGSIIKENVLIQHSNAIFHKKNRTAFPLDQQCPLMNISNEQVVVIAGETKQVPPTRKKKLERQLESWQGKLEEVKASSGKKRNKSRKIQHAFNIIKELQTELTTLDKQEKRQLLYDRGNKWMPRQEKQQRKSMPNQDIPQKF